MRSPDVSKMCSKGRRPATGSPSFELKAQSFSTCFEWRRQGLLGFWWGFIEAHDSVIIDTVAPLQEQVRRQLKQSSQ